MTTWYPGPLPESPAEIVEKKRLWAIYLPEREVPFFTDDPDAAAQYQRDYGYLVEECVDDEAAGS